MRRAGEIGRDRNAGHRDRGSSCKFAPRLYRSRWLVTKFISNFGLILAIGIAIAVITALFFAFLYAIAT
jgi:hypothetical protein